MVLLTLATNRPIFVAVSHVVSVTASEGGSFLRMSNGNQWAVLEDPSEVVELLREERAAI